MKVQIQYNGNAIALAIDNDENETQEQTLNRFINHGAVAPNDADNVETLPDGRLFLMTTREKFTRGLASWFEFKSGIEFESQRAKNFFRQRAESFVASLPVGRFARFHR